MRVVAIGGEPATGKSSLMKGLISSLVPAGPHQMERLKDGYFSFGTLKGYNVPRSKVVILGLYDGTRAFEGTDRLSMNVQANFEMYLLWAKEHQVFKDYTVLFEGDRLYNGPSLRRCQQYAQCLFLMLEVCELEKHRRHKARQDTQTEKFLKSRTTKYLRLLRDFPEIQVRQNNREDQQSAILSDVLAFVAGRTPQIPAV